jgi:hypothetical protein
VEPAHLGESHSCKWLCTKLFLREKINSIYVGMFDLLSANYNEQKSINITHPIQNEELTNIQKGF